MGLQRHTAGGLSVFQLLNASKMPIHQDCVGERPQMFGWLQFGRVRRQEEQVEMVGHTQALRAVPARTVQDQDKLLAR